MSDYLHIAATFLDPRFHGRGDGGEPEWPPSPLRLMQALVATGVTHGGQPLEQALSWLQSQHPPLIIAPCSRQAAPYCLSVPNNVMDIVAKAWARGDYAEKNNNNPSKHRAMKAVRPTLMTDGDTVHYLWKLDNAGDGLATTIETFRTAAHHIVALGWGVDLVVGHAGSLASEHIEQLSGERWWPTVSRRHALRTPKTGTLVALQERHKAFLQRIGKHGLTPVEPLTCFDMTGYRRPNDPIEQPCAIFELRNDDSSFFAYSQRQLIHVAGMVRHLAGKLAQASIPHDADNDWPACFVMGHRSNKGNPHRQLSYVPLPSIGHRHTDQLIRRVLLSAQPGDERWLEHVAARLAGGRLRPEHGNEFGDRPPPTLIRTYRDKITQQYMASAHQWTSVTPVILPGHDDHKPAKTRKLIAKALRQSGIEQPCDYSWHLRSRFRKSLSAYNTERNGRPVFFKPKYLRGLTALHLTITFKDGAKATGPMTIGAGRHCGFGLMAPIESACR